MLPKQMVAEVYDPSGDDLITVWRDFTVPNWTYDDTGLSDITLTIARPLGDADMPGDRVGTGALDFGNIVLLRVEDTDQGTAQLPGQEMRAGRLVPGRAIEGAGDEGIGTVVWGGFIARIEGDLPIISTIACLSARQFARTAPVLARNPFLFTSVRTEILIPTRGLSQPDNDPVRRARTALAQANVPLIWDIANPESAGDAQPYRAPVTPAGILDEQLQVLRRIAGPYWHCYVTPRFTVRMFASDPNTTDTPDHDLIAGVHCAAPHLAVDGSTLAEQVTVIYPSTKFFGQPGIDNDLATLLPSGLPWYVTEAPGGRIAATDATRHRAVRQEHVNDNRLASVRARDLLAANARPIVRGSVVVPDFRHPNAAATSGYDIDAFAPGQLVRITYEQPISDVPPMLAGRFIPGQSREALGGYGDVLVISQIEYRFTEAVLHFGQVVPDTANEMERMSKEIEMFQQTRT